MALVGDTPPHSSHQTNTMIAIGGNGGALRQLLTSQQFPDGNVSWAGRTLPCELLRRVLGSFLVYANPLACQ